MKIIIIIVITVVRIILHGYKLKKHLNKTSETGI
jgi:hypothetical protein